jgi:hypothetical protein
MIEQILHRIDYWAYGSLIFWAMTIVFTVALFPLNLSILLHSSENFSIKINKVFWKSALFLTICTDIVFLLCLTGVLNYTFFLILFPIDFIFMTVVLFFGKRERSMHILPLEVEEEPFEIKPVIGWVSVNITLICVVYYSYFGFWLPGNL